MHAPLAGIAQTCLNGAENNTMTVPQIVGTLMQAGFESYAIDFCRPTATYYLPDGDSIVLPAHRDATPVAAALDVTAVQAAIREAQQLVPGYTYVGFCTKVMTATPDEAAASRHDRTNSGAKPIAGAAQSGNLCRSWPLSRRPAANHPRGAGVNRDASLFLAGRDTGPSGGRGSAGREGSPGSIGQLRAGTAGAPAASSRRCNRPSRGRSSDR